jgi:carbamoyl-phosphate synthase small subunit
LGATGEIDGEVVFNTSMTGYQEILTDPSYCGQIVTMTYPQIGNYGVNPDDAESGRVYLRGFIVRELCQRPSNFRSTQPLDRFSGGGGGDRPLGNRHPDAGSGTSASKGR